MCSQIWLVSLPVRKEVKSIRPTNLFDNRKVLIVNNPLDLFAAHALPEVISVAIKTMSTIKGPDDLLRIKDQIAQVTFAIAHAMMRERDKQHLGTRTPTG